MSGTIDGCLAQIESAAIVGHTSPDGDCIGSCCALYQYICENYPAVRADLYLEEIKPAFFFVPGAKDARSAYDGASYDMLFILDVSAPDRIGVSAEITKHSRRTLCIDHHISNAGFADDNIIEPDASSASEVLYTLLDPEKISTAAATALYTGMIHDSGVFQYENTGCRTMEIAGKLIAKGVPFASIIEDSFTSRTFREARALGLVLGRMESLCGGQCVYGYITRAEMEDLGVTKPELDGIVAQMRLTKGAVIAVFVYPFGEEHCKVSFRSRADADVRRIAEQFGGGGHVRAAGCTLTGAPESARERLLEAVCASLGATEADASSER